MADRAGHQTQRLKLRLARFILSLAIAGWGCSVDAAGLDATVRTPSGAPVEDAAVILEPVAGGAPRVRRRATIEQRNREFSPYLTIVEKGAAVDFPNHDPFKHHVYSFSPPNVFEIKLYVDKPAKPIVFDKSGHVALGCNIHDWMEAHVLVVDTPWFAKTGSDGRARIERVPAGSYRLRLWHPRQQAAAADVGVELEGVGTRRVDLTLDVAPRAAINKPPLDDGDYTLKQ